MSRKKRTSSEPSSFGKLLGWTVVLALVFSAGLITGQRLLRRQALPPLVSLQTSEKAETEPIETGEERLPTTFSFYEHLGEKPEAAGTADEGTSTEAKKAEKAEKAERAEKEKPAPRPDPEANKPAPAEAAKTEANQAAADEKPSQPKPADSAAEKVIKQVADALAEDDSKKELPARYTLQIGSHTDRQSADQQISKLESMGLEPHVVMVEVPERGRFFRVRVGKFHSMEEARNFQGEIQNSRGVSSFVSPI